MNTLFLDWLLERELYEDICVGVHGDYVPKVGQQVKIRGTVYTVDDIDVDDLVYLVPSYIPDGPGRLITVHRLREIMDKDN